MSKSGSVNPQESWFDIGTYVSVSAPYDDWPEAPWLLRVITPDDDLPGRVRVFQVMEKPHVAQIEAAIEQWLTHGTLPQLPHPASYFLGLRFATVGLLLMGFDAVFPPLPAESVGDVCRKFLLDWWRAHGATYAVGFAFSERDIEGQI